MYTRRYSAPKELVILQFDPSVVEISTGIQTGAFEACVKQLKKVVFHGGLQNEQ